MLNTVRLVALCARGKKVTVMVAGKSFELPEALNPVPAKPDPLQVLSAELLERDVESRRRTDEALSAVREVASSVHSAVERGVAEIARTAKLDVVPVYDEHGKLVCARRIDKKGA